MVKTSGEKAQTVSIVIPVFNEQHQIKGCLGAIAAQTVPPDEVIVVDNNCTDSTVKLAREFPFVRVIKESRQGRGPARTAGFNAATGDIIGRIDADSRLTPDWVARIKADFTDPSLDSVTGLAYTRALPRLSWPRTLIWSRAYYWLVHSHFRTITMWGSNMALRREAWHRVAKRVVNDDHLVHEDQDVSLAIAASGGRIIVDSKLLISTGEQSFMFLPKLLWYTALRGRTYKLHKQNGNLSKVKYTLGFWQTLPGAIGALVLGTPLLLASIVLLPLDLLMIGLGRSKTWFY